MPGPGHGTRGGAWQEEVSRDERPVERGCPYFRQGTQVVADRGEPDRGRPDCSEVAESELIASGVTEAGNFVGAAMRGAYGG